MAQQKEVSKKKSAAKKSVGEIMRSDQFKTLVDGALHDMDVMETALTKSGMNEVDARLKVQQMYFKNLQTFSDPVVASQSILAELKTRIDLDRIMNPDQELITDKYIDLLSEMRKTIDLNLKAQGKVMTHRVQKLDDQTMKFGEFIDVGDE